VTAIVLLASPGAAQAATGALTPRGCVADPVNNPDACGQTANGLDGAVSAVISRDGTSVYAVGQGDNAIVRFNRDPITGALTPKGCVADVSANPDGCAQTAKGLVTPYTVALSRDGTSLYVAASSPGTIVRFSRDTRTGKLTPKGCIGEKGANPEGCGQTAKGLDGADALAVSNDGISVYVAGYNKNTIAIFRRHTSSGALTPKGCIGERSDNLDNCHQTVAGGIEEPYLGSVTVSSDGRSVYAAGSAGPSIALFRRSTTTGALQPKGCIADPTNNPEACTRTAAGLVNPYMVALSRDGTSAYVADYGTSGVVLFKRGTKTGALKLKGCIADPAHNTGGCTRTAPGLYGTGWVAVSSDGKSVYTSAAVSSAIVIFARDATTGDLKKRGCTADLTHNPSNCSGTAPGLFSVEALAISGDGKSLYAAGLGDNAVARFRRQN
jgi:6-phosphogluconolactonase (cycloisomerase 2 family)